jgi:hypothetical protein
MVHGDWRCTLAHNSDPWIFCKNNKLAYTTNKADINNIKPIIIAYTNINHH